MIIQTAKRLDQVSEYYFSQKLKEVEKLRAEGREVINLGIGSPDMPPSTNTVNTLCKQALSENNHGYAPYLGAASLRKAMTAWYRRTYDVMLDPETEILPLIGSKEGIFHVSMAFLNPGDKVLVPDPGYAGYSAAARIAGAETMTYDLTEANGWFPDLEALDATWDSSIKIMWVNYPHMPTGALAEPWRFEQLINFAREKKILICHDNPYSLILNDREPLSIMHSKDAFDYCLELNSLSKSHNMAGWRLGMVTGKRDYIKAILAVKSNIDSGMFLPIQHAGTAALENSRQWHHEMNELYRKRRGLIYGLMDVMGFHYQRNTAGLFVWGRAPREISQVDAFLDDLLYKAGVFLTPGKIFGKNGERYVRISTCASEEKILLATRRIGKFLAHGHAKKSRTSNRPNPSRDEVLLHDLRGEIDGIDQQLIEMILRRTKVAARIGQYKKNHNMSVLQSQRWQEVLQDRLAQATALGLDPETIRAIYQNLHHQSIQVQECPLTSAV